MALRVERMIVTVYRVNYCTLIVLQVVIAVELRSKKQLIFDKHTSSAVPVNNIISMCVLLLPCL